MEKKELSQEQIDAISAGTGLSKPVIIRIFAAINPADIETVTVLKDAAASAGYALSDEQAAYYFAEITKK